MTDVEIRTTPHPRLKLGVAGLGKAFTVMLPSLAADPRIELVAAADPRPEATRRFASDFDARVYASVGELCADSGVEVVYLATPHQHHAEHIAVAAAHGKHVLVEKPMAISLAECDRIIDAVERAGIVLVVGHSHGFDRPIQRTRELIDEGTVGGARMINALYYTDFLYRPRRPEELVTAEGGGVVFSQGAHQVDIVRLLGGGRVARVRALTGAWDSARPTEGAYAALLTFVDGAFASILYSGYAHFDGDELTAGIGELGREKAADWYGSARRNLKRATNALEEAALKQARNYGGVDYREPGAPGASGAWYEHFGFVLVSCDRADLRPLPTGVMIYGDDVARFEPLPRPEVPRAEVFDELYGAIVRGRPPLHDARWAKATLEVCLAMLDSAREGREIALAHQVRIKR
ncbi:MAG TPA: Gfo/Idh/MocA family oxidoreductase [Casimicrobiaceae bacterium]|nr:Gfo/Idh/MocA family oxidoreductase [Casimicrobiaceae bacterium]